jgi:ABC-2 type transport system permease protein
MRTYLAAARFSFRRQSTYRAATVAGAFTNIVFGLILASVLLAVFRERPTVGTLDASRAVTFTFVGQGLLVVMGTFGWREVADRIVTGDIAVDLYRPVSFSTWWASVWLGRTGFALLARGVPPFLVGALVFHLRLPTRLVTWPAFLLAVVAGTLVASRFWLLVNLVAFWLLDIRGALSLAIVAVTVASGFIVPLQFVGGWFGALCRWSPFATFAQYPIEVFLELRAPWRAYCAALAWLVALELAVRAVLRAAMHEVVLQGG